ncbi:minor capsid protein [Lactiplantibacillus plajomi]|uniref:Minor capsid protein n=1 Tax=Lactiplantibacillus plajomi TaxID=1457217 RepID=A0ABV6K0T7_9LACO|nr:minor capsid protein [Lactiplantibacillus plajomi]
MTKLSYWEKRHLREKQREIKSAQQFEKGIQAELNGAYRELAKEASMWVDRYTKNQGLNSEQAMRALHGIRTKHWRMTLKRFEAKAKQGGYQDELDAEYYRSRLARLSSLEEQMRKLTRGLAKKHTSKMETALANEYQETYMRTTYHTQAQHGAFTADFARFNEIQLRTIVSRPWAKDGKDFSQRIWQNYQQELPSYLMDSLFRATVMGWGVDKVAQRMHAQFQDVKRNQIHNLVQTELGHVQEEATAKSYEESGIKQYEYMATLETHTCTVCAKLDGQRFKLSEREVGINYPLMHPRCRCTTVPWMADLPEIGERWMRDPKTGKGKLIKNVTYADWWKEYGIADKVWNNGDITQMLSNKPIVRISQLTAAQLEGMIAQVKRPRPDVLDDIHHGAYRQNMLDYAHEQGYDTKPTILSWKDSLLIPDSAKIYRYTDRKQQLLHGDLEYSTTKNSLNGRGIYFGADYKFTAKKYNHVPNELVTAAMTADSIIVSQFKFQAALQKQMRILGIKEDIQPLIGEVLFDYIAMGLGVDGWYNKNGDKFVVLNRGKVGIIDENK